MTFFVRNLSIVAWVLVSQVSHSSNAWCQPPEQALSRPSATVARPLAAVLSENQTGMMFEPDDKRELLKLQAKEFVALKNGRLDAKVREKLVAECSKVYAASSAPSLDSNPFCAEILAEESASRSPAGRKVRLRRERKPNLSAELVAARIPVLNKASEGDIMRAMKRVGNIRKLGKLISAVESSKTCVSPSLTTALGFKAEENFPEPDSIKLAQEMYGRSGDCGTGDSSIKARYRLGLIDVWQNKCEDAEKRLSGIVDLDEAGDYRSRVVYWRLHCARQMKNEKLQAQLRDRLLRDHPLSLHSLFVDGDLADLAIVNPREPDVLFRSSKTPTANPSVRAAEALFAVEAKDLAMDMLEAGIEHIKSAEPQFQLYVAVLLHRAGETIPKFQLLSSIFRDQPSFISKLTMEMLYPLKRFDVINLHKARVNPYLVISLIRQESAFNDRARSPAGAMGLMQLMPGTARRMEHVSRRELFDPKTNIRLGVKYVAHLLERYEGDAELALAAYNAGPDKVDSWKRRYPVDNRLLFLDLIPFRETREYVASIARNYYWYLRLYSRAEESDRGPASVAKVSPKPASSRVFSFFKF